MISRILDLLLGAAPEKPLPEADSQHLLGALVVRMAQADERLQLAELKAMDRLFADRFGLGPVDAARMRADCERLATALPPTEALGPMLTATLTAEERAGLAETLRAIATADGEIAPAEAAMLAAVARLLTAPEQAAP